MPRASLRDLDVAGKRVFVRADLNVPMRNGRITDTTRIRSSLPTIQFLLDGGAAVILASHLGRPGGRRVEEMSMAPVARELGTQLQRPVMLAPDSTGSDVERMAAGLQPGQILLLENLRFHPEEEANDPVYARQLAGLADLYVDDAFGAAHRAHASTSGITKYLPSVAGFLLENELSALKDVLSHPVHPFVFLVGGAKISSKIAVLQNLLPVADSFLIGGGMANTFLKASGVDVAASLVENTEIDVALEFLRAAEEQRRKVLLPVDAVIADHVADQVLHKVVPVDQIPRDWAIVDIGPGTIEIFAAEIRAAGQVVWNGPMGVFEIPTFAHGTVAMARAIGESQAKSLVGGGDSVAAVEQAGLADQFDHISTGGGASLEFLEGRVLPGVEALMNEPAVRISK